jgi:hypothetical protein
MIEDDLVSGVDRINLFRAARRRLRVPPIPAFEPDVVARPVLFLEQRITDALTIPQDDVVFCPQLMIAPIVSDPESVGLFYAAQPLKTRPRHEKAQEIRAFAT